MSTGLFFDTLLTAYLSRGMMLYTAILLVLCAVVFFNRKTPKKRRIFCGAVVTYCILYFVVVFVLGSLFSSNHEPAPPVLVSADSVVYAEVREMQKENAKEVTLHPNENPAHEELVSALASALNAMPPHENEEDYDKDAAIFDVVFKFENGLARTTTICENLTYVKTGGLFKTTEDLIVACQTALAAEESIALEGTVFTYNGVSYDFAELEELESANLVYNLYEYTHVGDRILVLGSMGKNAGYYAVFNPSTQTFERGITAAHFIYQDDDIQSAVYSFEKSIYRYDGTLITILDLKESEYIYDISFAETGSQLLVDIAIITSDDPPRQEIVYLS